MADVSDKIISDVNNDTVINFTIHSTYYRRKES